MYGSDFYVEKEGGCYALYCSQGKVRCARGEYFVEHVSRDLIDFICFDLDRCGEIDLNEDGSLEVNSTFSAYIIFSEQKVNVENNPKIAKCITGPLIQDMSLIQIANGPPLELEQITRLAPVRTALCNYIGDDDFAYLTEAAWGTYYYQMNGQESGPLDEISNEAWHAVSSGWDGPGTLCRTEDVEKSSAASKLEKLYLSLTPERQAAVFALICVNEWVSSILALSLVCGWINKRSYVSAVMGLGSNILNLSGVDDDSTNQVHQDSFRLIEEAAEIALGYVECSNGAQDRIINKDEGLQHEYKASFRTPFPDYPEPQLNDAGQTVYKLGKKSFKSKREVEKYIESQSLKTIVAFLNTKGGTLVIGVCEQSRQNEVVGIDREGFESDDHYERHIVQQIINRIGPQFAGDFVEVHTMWVGEGRVCVVECEEYIPAANQIPAHLDGTTCYRRTGPRTDEVKMGEEFARFVVDRLKV